MFAYGFFSRSAQLAVLFFAFFIFPQPATGSDSTLDSLGEALTKGTPYVDIRYRFEHVEQSNFSRDADASTLRTRVGYKTEKFEGFSGVLEVENVSPVGAEHYNDGGSTPSNSSFPTVADPIGTEINQAKIIYNAPFDTEITYGRSRWVLGNARFVGDVGWRQNDQTFDSATVVSKTIPDTTLIYSYVWGVNRIFGDDDAAGDLDGSAHLMDATYDGVPFGQLRAYAYLLDIDDSAANSSNTYGTSFEGDIDVRDRVKALYHVEYARQSDAGNNPTNYDANYIHLNGGVSFAGLTLKGGFEELGSDNGTFGFATPLATLHKFNGWADQFLATPADGLEDVYGLASYTVKGINDTLNNMKLTLVYHDFSQDNGSADYGSEWDVEIIRSFLKYYAAGIKYANYDSDGSGSAATNDAEKIIFSLGFKFN